MASLKKRRRLRGFVVMPDGNRHTSGLRSLLTQIAGERSGCKIDLIFAHERLTTDFLLIKNLRRLVAHSDFVLCVTEGQDPDIAFEAGLAYGLRKSLVLVLLPETRTLPATFMGHFYVELSGDVSDHPRLSSALARVVAGLAGKADASASDG